MKHVCNNLLTCALKDLYENVYGVLLVLTPNWKALKCLSIAGGTNGGTLTHWNTTQQ